MRNMRSVAFMTAVALYAVLVFFLDVITPAGLEVWVLNLPLVVLPVMYRSSRMVVLLSLVGTATVVIGWALSPPGHNPPLWDSLNRDMGLATTADCALVGTAPTQ